MPKPAVHTRTIEISTEAFEELTAYSEATGVPIDAAIAEAIQDFVDVCIPARIGEPDRAVVAA